MHGLQSIGVLGLVCVIFLSSVSCVLSWGKWLFACLGSRLLLASETPLFRHLVCTKLSLGRVFRFFAGGILAGGSCYG